MPIENESKYVIFPPYNSVEQIVKLEGELVLIRQAYISSDVRIRECISTVNNSVDYKFTFKRRIGNNNLEIETPITKEDFDALLLMSLRELKKRRYIIPDTCFGEEWIIDFFVDERDKPYIVVAECEMADSNQIIPAVIPVNISDFDFYLVPRSLQSLYSSKKLAKKEYAIGLLESLLANLEDK